jgi:hypothetical protein
MESDYASPDDEDEFELSDPNTFDSEGPKPKVKREQMEKVVRRGEGVG